MISARTIRLAVTVLFVSAANGLAATPALVIFQEGVDLKAASSALEATGARVRQRVPPRLLVADFQTAKPSVAGAAAVYTGAVPLSALDALGPVAVAAGVNWNRQLLAGAAQTGAAGAMRQAVSSHSLTPPVGLTVRTGADRLACAWTAVNGASFYEVQASADPSFSSVYVFTSAREPAVAIALPDAVGAAYVRARAVDLGRVGEEDDARGAWSQAVTATVPAVPSASGAAPAISAPSDGAETRGTALLMEWTGAIATRLQVSRSASFSTTIFDEVTDASPYACASQAIAVGDRLYWRARAEGPSRSAWTAARAVSIGATVIDHVDSFVNPEAPR